MRSMEQEKNKHDAKVAVNGSGKLQPKAIVSVTGTPSFAGVLTFQREALNGTQFKVVVADATIRNLKSTQGYLVSGKRTDGWLTTEVVHDFGSNDTKAKASVKQVQDGRTYGVDYTHYASKPTAGVVDASVEVNKGLKLAAGYNLGNQLASLSATKKDGELTYTASVNSRQAVKLGVSRKQGDTSWGATYIFPVLVAGEYKHRDFKMAASAPVTQEGVGDVKLQAMWERTIAL